MPKFIVTTKRGDKYRLDDANEIHRGGEGRIIAFDAINTLVAKIYHKGINPITEPQFNYLNKLDKKLFVVPQELLLKKGQIIGFTMEYIAKDYFPLSTIFSKNFCAKNNITPAVKQKIGNKLIKALDTAHKQNIVIGDFNQYNILINNKGEIKLIDVDSYQTPNHLHTRMLLDDIRDYLYNGQISEKSDYFALSILLFYSFTYTHPFKGIHKIHKKLSERMINKIPIFKNDPDLRLPKCYTPITIKEVQQQFERHYIDGERFLIALTKKVSTVIKKLKPLTVKTFIQKDLSITSIVQDSNIMDINFVNSTGYIETKDNYLIYNAKHKGYLSQTHKISKKKWDDIFICDKNILLRKNSSLYHYKSETNITEITNFKFSIEPIIYQLNDILIEIDRDVMHWLYLKDIINTSVRHKRTDVFGKSFNCFTGLVQNIGGINRIFYNTGKDIAIVKFDVKIKEIYQQSNIGIVQYIDNNNVKNSYFKINGLNLEISTNKPQRVLEFAYMPTKHGEGFVFQPSDNKIKIIRTSDFKQISTLTCDLITEQTKLQYSKSGIIAWKRNSAYLLNKK